MKDMNTTNLLPQDGKVLYLGQVFCINDCTDLFETLLEEIEWRNDEAFIFGKHIITKRKVAWYAEKEFSYTYSKVTKKAKLWTKTLREIKERVEDISGETYNSCLLNLYHDGSEGMAYHSDSEKELKNNGTIASVSFGAERKFSFKHILTKERVDILLENGSLLLMKGSTQKKWQHRLPPTKKVLTPRINLTFRTINT